MTPQQQPSRNFEKYKVSYLQVLSTYLQVHESTWHTQGLTGRSLGETERKPEPEVLPVFGVEVEASRVLCVHSLWVSLKEESRN